MKYNVVIGSPIVEPKTLIALDDIDWETNEKEKTLFTDTRFLPAIMKEAGIVKSIAEVRKEIVDLKNFIMKLRIYMVLVLGMTRKKEDI